MMLPILFWASLALIVYVYLGYPLLIYAWSRTKRQSGSQPKLGPDELPSVTLIIPAYNEERWIRRKIENALETDYPRERMEVLVASDGSADATAEIAKTFEWLGVKVLAFPGRLGKQEMLNRLVPKATGEIVVMTDANALLERSAVRRLISLFADPQIGCVTGKRICVPQAQSAPSVGEGLYWRYESWIKNSESRVHSCLGAHGQLYAVRRSVFPHVEKVGEDFYIPMKIIAATALRVVYESAAMAWIPAAANLRIEFERKARAHVSFLLTLPMLKELLLPWRTPVWWQYISHHVLRMLVPPAMVALLISSAALAAGSDFYLFAAAAQAGFYGLAGIGALLARFGLRPKPFYVPFYFVFANAAIALSLLRWPVHKFDHAWQRTERLLDPH